MDHWVTEPLRRLYPILEMLIPSRNLDWSSFVFERLNTTVRLYQTEKNTSFAGPIVFLMLLYVDRLDFAGDLHLRNFPIVKCWSHDQMRIRVDKEEKASGFGYGKVLPRISSEVVVPASQNADPIPTFEKDLPVHELKKNKEIGSTSKEASTSSKRLRDDSDEEEAVWKEIWYNSSKAREHTCNTIKLFGKLRRLHNREPDAEIVKKYNDATAIHRDVVNQSEKVSQCSFDWWDSDEWCTDDLCLKVDTMAEEWETAKKAKLDKEKQNSEVPTFPFIPISNPDTSTNPKDFVNPEDILLEPRPDAGEPIELGSDMPKWSDDLTQMLDDLGLENVLKIVDESVKTSKTEAVVGGTDCIKLVWSGMWVMLGKEKRMLMRMLKAVEKKGMLMRMLKVVEKKRMLMRFQKMRKIIMNQMLKQIYLKMIVRSFRITFLKTGIFNKAARLLQRGFKMPNSSSGKRLIMTVRPPTPTKKTRKLTWLPPHLCSPFQTRVIKLGGKLSNAGKKTCAYAFIPFEQGVDQMELMFDSKQWGFELRRIIVDSLRPNKYVCTDIISVWSMYCNYMELKKDPQSTGRFYADIIATLYLEVEFKKLTQVMDQTESFRSSMSKTLAQFCHIDLSKVELFFFPVLFDENHCVRNHFVLYVYNFKFNRVDILDNLVTKGLKPLQKYHPHASMLKTGFWAWLHQIGDSRELEIAKFPVAKSIPMQCSSSKNEVDCGVYLMRHMETYFGNPDFNCKIRKDRPIDLEYL